MSDEYPLIPPPSSVKMSRFHVVDGTFHSVEYSVRVLVLELEHPERGLVRSVLVERFQAMMGMRASSRFGFGGDEGRAETGPGIRGWGSPGALPTSVIWPVECEDSEMTMFACDKGVEVFLRDLGESKMANGWQFVGGRGSPM